MSNYTFFRLLLPVLISLCVTSVALTTHRLAVVMSRCVSARMITAYSAVSG
jgi:hypothetical protein